MVHSDNHCKQNGDAEETKFADDNNDKDDRQGSLNINISKLEEDEEEEKETMGVNTRGAIKKPYYGLTKLLVMKVALPHVGLSILIVVYTIFGAFVFKHLEQDELSRSITKARKNVTLEKMTFLNRIQEIMFNGSGLKNDSLGVAMERYVLNLHKIYRSDGGRYVGKPTNTSDPWTFDKCLFFGATTFASIGYGTQTPTTRYGRIFCIIFALFGLPLAVIMIADLAKFVSKFVVWCYTRWLMQKHQIRKICCYICDRRVAAKAASRKRRSRTSSAFAKQCQNNKEGDDEFDEEEDDDEEEEIAEFLWMNLENAKFVEVPALLMFVIILLYVTLGAFLFIPIEHWTFTEGFYFSIISILAIGFGDFTPKNEKFIYVSLFYILFGLLLTTTCIDVVGIQYINKIHNFGRRLTKTDPLIWLRAVQERRLRRMKRHAMMALFNTLTAVNRMKFDASVERAFQKSNENSMDMALLNDLVKQSKDPPSEPKNFHAESVSVFSVMLRWDPPVSGSTEGLHYLLNYRLRHAPRKTAMTVVEPLLECFFEVTSLRSFSLYHFSLTAVNKYGRSSSVFTQEYTEPSSVPLNLRAEQITDNSVTLCWDSPVKNKEGERQYIVHYTPSMDKPMEEWIRVDVGPSKVYTANQLNTCSKYAFTVSANHNGKLAIFSRSLQVNTKSISSMKKISSRANSTSDSSTHAPTTVRLFNATVSLDKDYG